MALDTAKPQDIDRWAEDNARLFKKDGLKTNQIRNFYAAITRLRVDFERAKKFTDEIESSLVFLKPKLAYAAGRQKAVRDNFYPFMKQQIDDVLACEDKEKALKNFFSLIEGVVAYHKFYGDN